MLEACTFDGDCVLATVDARAFAEPTCAVAIPALGLASNDGGFGVAHESHDVASDGSETAGSDAKWKGDGNISTFVRTMGLCPREISC
ncbi:hypothetical protein CDL15_Pgr002961 [Punica granatum]|uniref:Uncharacterized protein n=1 Tax=Punica granatum TaxID=22663 RepID=A0A218X2A8_PUNGR|nr:hypothetical protein CDL15_Pgr002961 [Punica granatum]